MSWWKRALREPLVHFVAIGAVLFAIDAWRSEPTPASSDPVPVPVTVTVTDAGVRTGPKTIVIDADTRKAIAANAQRRLGHAPNPAELAEETERWIDEEVLYREAVARELDRGDPFVHERIAGRMSYVLEQALVVREPTEAELRAWFDQHRTKWSRPEQIDFTHVFIANGDAARANEAARALASGAAPERLGDPFSGGHRYRGRTLADLAQAFGDEFVKDLATQKPGAWVQRRSRYGMHVVRLDHVEAAAGATFEAAKLDVRKDWLEAHKAEQLGAAMRELRGDWTIEKR